MYDFSDGVFSRKVLAKGCGAHDGEGGDDYFEEEAGAGCHG